MIQYCSSSDSVHIHVLFKVSVLVQHTTNDLSQSIYRPGRLVRVAAEIMGLGWDIFISHVLETAGPLLPAGTI